MATESSHMTEFISYLHGVYANTNQHLLEQGKKRDQIITFYIVLLSFVLTNLENLDHDFFGKPTEMVIYFVLIIVGGIVLLNLADLRSWHTQYLDVIYVINWTIAHYNEFDNVPKLQKKMKTLMKKPLNVKNKPPISSFGAWIKYWFFGSTDNTVYTGMIFLISLPNFGFLSRTPLSLSARIAIYIVILTSLLWYFERHLQKVLKNSQAYNTWILSFDYNGKIK